MNKNKELRILYLLKSFNMGGAQKSTIQFANYLSEKVDYIGILGNPGFYLTNGFINKNVEIFDSNKNLYKIQYFFQNLKYIFRIINKQNIKIIHYHYRLFLPYIYIIKLFNPKLKIFYTHHSTYGDTLTFLLFADCYICISETVKKDLQSFSLINRKEIVIHNGVDVHLKLNNPSSLNNIGIIGRLEEIKGIGFIIKHINDILNIHKDINIIFRGEGNYGSALKYITKTSKRVFLYKPAYTLDEIYSNLSILLVPSVCESKHAVEGVPMVILEAMSLRIPVIASSIGGIKDVVINNSTGLTFKSGDIVELTNCIRDLIYNEQLRATLTNNAFKLIEQKYSTQFNANLLLNYYESL